MDPRCLPKPIKWGIDNEKCACKEYITYMRANGHEGLHSTPCGFIIHPSLGWLGASLDAVVTDPSTIFVDGIAEFKCPFTKKDISPFEACQDPNFYCTMTDDNNLHLKRDHRSYHQVQLQLFVSIDMCHWCDFCIYTLKGVAVEKIWLDSEWSNKYVIELESYFDGHMLPEIICPKLKPSYIL
jgi:NAD-dependent dihydropyrimidine dehydrogenase PreA subunit